MNPSQFVPSEGPARFLDFWVTGILHASMLSPDYLVGIDDDWFDVDGFVESALRPEHKEKYHRAVESDADMGHSFECRFEYLYTNGYKGFFVSAHAPSPRGFHHDDNGKLNGCSFGGGMYFFESAYGDTLEAAYKAVADKLAKRYVSAYEAHKSKESGNGSEEG